MRDNPWLHIIGIGEDGVDGLSLEAKALVADAEVIIGGDRHHDLAENSSAKRVSWPSPFDAMIEKIHSFKGQRVIILVTGDPLWYSVGARISRAINPAEIVFHPQISAFQWAACRMGWSLPDVETLTVHGRPVEQILPYVLPDTRLLVLSKDHNTPQEIATLLSERGYGKSRIVALASMGGKDEARFEGRAEDWHHRVTDFHSLAIECIAEADVQPLPLSGLGDDEFQHDGNITKQAVRAITIAKLVPERDGLLWDIGCGSATVAIEWMRSAGEARAIGIEVREDRLEFARSNALKLGTPALNLIAGNASEVLDGLPTPDAIFIGGGVSAQLIEHCIGALKPRGRLVANGVTLESEAILAQAYQEFGGELQRIQVQSAAPLGKYESWKSAMPVTQWAYHKDGSDER